MSKKILAIFLGMAIILFAVPMVALSANGLAGREIVSMRTETSKVFYGEVNGRYILEASQNAIHYLDNGQWVDIDNGFETATAPWDWQMTGAGYHLQVKEDITSGQILEYSIGGDSVAFQPMSLEWTNNLGQIQQISMPQDVTPIIENYETELLPNTVSRQGTITWPDAYGNGINFRWKSNPTRLVKNLVIENFNNIPNPQQYIIDGGNPLLRLNLIFAPSSDLDIYVDGQVWNQRDKAQTFNIIEFRKGDEILWGFMPLIYQGSNHNIDPYLNQGQSIATLSKSGKKLYISVEVPYEWLQAATYPVYIDADVDKQVSQSSDDAFRSTLEWTTVDVLLKAGDFDANFYDYQSGLRFQNIAIAPASTIDTAYISINANFRNTPVNTVILGEDTDDAATFTTAANFDGRSRTTASVNWPAPANWNWQTYYDSPEIKTVIQEIVDRGGWGSGQDMAVFWRYDVAGWGGALAITYGHSFDNGVNKPAKLHIEYTPVSLPTVSTDAATGVGTTSATLNGEITNTGGQNNDVRGFVWDTASHGDPGNVAPAASGYPDNWTEAGAFGLGIFSHIVVGLLSNTTYYYRAASHNIAGWSYGGEQSFTTLAPAGGLSLIMVAFGFIVLIAGWRYLYGN